jgi:hypothetical protein
VVKGVRVSHAAAVVLNVWRAEEAAAWKGTSEEYELAIASSDGRRYEHDNINSAYAMLDGLERDPFVVEVDLIGRDLHRRFRRDGDTLAMVKVDR